MRIHIVDFLGIFFHEETFSARSLIFDTHLNERHSVTLEKQRNPFADPAGSSENRLDVANECDERTDGQSIYTALRRRGLAMRILFVCPSVKRVICDEMEERSVRFLYHTKDHLASFSEKKNGWWGGDPFYLKF